MRRVFSAIAISLTLYAPAWALDAVPLPRPRPQMPVEPRSFAEANPGLFNTKELTAAASACRLRLDVVAVVEPLPRLIGPGICGGVDMVRLKAVLMPDSRQVEIKPAPDLRCEMAEAIAGWLREDVAPKFAEPLLQGVENYDDYECRERNRTAGAKMSEHGKGNALDIRSFRLVDGGTILPTDPKVAHDLRAGLRESACRRFTTVLGPGSDGHHEAHIHLDIAARNGTKPICRWEVRDPAPDIARVEIPLPPPRPLFHDNSAPSNDKRKL